MATCVCGAPVSWVVIASGQKIALDTIPSVYGEGRFVIADYVTQPMRAEAVTPYAPVSAYTEHARSCPRA